MNRELYEKYLATNHWQGKRTKTLRLSKGRCQRCGDLADDCHHTTYKSLGHEVPGVNVIAVCRPCHDFLEGLSTFDPAATPPDDEPPHEPPPCVECGRVAEAMTDDEEPICRDCLRERCEPDDEPPHKPPPCIDCGWVAECLTDDEEPICRDCLRRRCEPD